MNSLVEDSRLPAKLTYLLEIRLMLILTLIIRILTGVMTGVCILCIAMHYVPDTSLEILNVRYEIGDIESNGLEKFWILGRKENGEVKRNDNSDRKRRGLRALKEWWDNTSLGIALKDREGDLLSEEYKRKKKAWFGGYFVTIMAVLYVVVRYIVRLSRGFDFIVFPGIVMFMALIVLVGVNYMNIREFVMMVSRYKEKKRNGEYKGQHRGMGGGRFHPDKWRLLLNAGKLWGGGFIGIGGGILVGNEIGRIYGHEDIVTKTLEGYTKKMGLHKEVREANRIAREKEYVEKLLLENERLEKELKELEKELESIGKK